MSGEDPYTTNCFFHGEERVIPEGNYQTPVCHECGHAFVNFLDLVKQFNEKVGPTEKQPLTLKDTVPFCPLCSHDF